MKKRIFKKWWFWVIVAIVVLLIIAILPIWCSTYYLPDPLTQTAIEKTHCGPIFSMGRVY